MRRIDAVDGGQAEGESDISAMASALSSANP
jgi:hypothetical protein